MRRAKIYTISDVLEVRESVDGFVIAVKGSRFDEVVELNYQKNTLQRDILGTEVQIITESDNTQLGLIASVFGVSTEIKSYLFVDDTHIAFVDGNSGVTILDLSTQEAYTLNVGSEIVSALVLLDSDRLAFVSAGNIVNV
ncbi:MAG: hypothetical protein P9L98_02340 [Candidatus Kaelpia imicola]|nr:hypothetical protein [Candidatus Kaelpia imicola]